MGQLRVSQIRRKVKNHLDRERYEHTLGVMYTAGAMAMCYNVELEQAMLAGLLHDCAKCIPDTKKIVLCDKYHLNVSEAESDNHSLLHAKLGAFLTAKKYHIYDKEIINAIASHTTGRPEMTMLDKVIYIADYIEPGRSEIPELSEIRKLAFEDINECLYRIVKNSLSYLETMDLTIDPMTEKTYIYYKCKLNKHELK
ncbi:MAG: bis(5'-nucleosyl)-tetraphosphatase (symmetrical) YqeK [Lachnospiraceae bacterium]